MIWANFFGVVIFAGLLGAIAALGILKCIDACGIPYSKQIRLTFIWLLIIWVFFWRFGSLIAVVAPLHQVDLRQFLSMVIDGGVVAVGLKADLEAFYTHAPRLMEKDLVQWVVNIATAISAYVILIMAQNYADDLIRSIVHISPDRLPEAQRVLTLWFAIYWWLSVLFLLSYVAVIVGPFFVMFFRPFKFERLTYVVVGMMPILVALAYAPVVSTARRDTQMSDKFTLFEASMILHASFVRNRTEEDVAKVHGATDPADTFICRNLSGDTLIAFVTPLEAVPSKVLIADASDSAMTVNFKLASCENTSNPDSLR